MPQSKEGNTYCTIKYDTDLSRKYSNVFINNNKDVKIAFIFSNNSIKIHK